MTQKMSNILLTEVSRFVEANMGLSFPQEKWGDMERGLHSLAAQFGCADEAALARHLIASPLSRRQIAILASGLTTGETYFFREKRTFAAFEEIIHSEFSQKRSGTERNLRIWSAGCCSGEEPYTIAMLLKMHLPDLREWKITLLATDINPLFLEKAVQGVYTKWSFREVPEEIIHRFFIKKGESFEIDPEIREMVTFSCHNLMRDDYPSLLNNTSGMDVIFCRNTLMYFAPATIKNVAQNFHRCLSDGGRLIVSQTEFNDEYFPGFEKTSRDGAIFLVKAAGSPLTKGDSGGFAVDFSNAPLGPPLPRRDFKPKDRAEKSAAALSQMARTCANQGRLDEALGHIEAALKVEKMNAGRHYLHAAILIEKARKEEAMAALQKAVYLDADFALAYFALGSLALGARQRADAERHFNHALLLLRKHAVDDLLPEAEGMTAGSLAELIESMQWRKQERR